MPLFVLGQILLVLTHPQLSDTLSYCKYWDTFNYVTPLVIDKYFELLGKSYSKYWDTFNYGTPLVIEKILL